MPDEDSNEAPLFGAHTAVDSATPDTAPVEEVPTEDDGMVQMAIAAPWRFSAFKTPVLPGVTLTPEWQSYDRETAEALYHEARRSGFTVSSSVDFSAPTTEGGN